MRAFGVTIFLGVAVAMAGCAADSAAPRAEGGGAYAKANPTPHYRISDGAGASLMCDLGEPKMLSAALMDYSSMARVARKVVLVRRGPEGMTRDVIPINAAGRLADPASDRVLRDGDTIVVPTREPSPVGLARPMSVPGVMN